MSIEVQKAPIVSQIVLDQSKDDLQFTLDESGVITNSSKKFNSTYTQPKEISAGHTDIMASRYSDGYDSYDDDFEDESPVRNGSRTTRQRQPSLESDYTPSPPTTRRNHNNSTRRNSLVSYRSAYGPSRATNKPKKGKKSLSASTRPPKTDDNSTMVKKILSANRNKITKLYNVVEELQHEVDNLRQENRTLKRISVKQERELKRVDREEGSLPQLLQRHSAELRTYRERLKKNKHEILRKERETHSHDVELNKLRDKLQHYKELDNNKKLEERATLAKKLEKVEKALAERDTKILELQKTIKLSEKARHREIKDQQERFKKTKEELVKVQENVVSLREKLKEKEKQLDMTNIYHQNVQRKLKKVNPLALPPAEEDSDMNKNIPVANLSVAEKKRTNVFLTNDISDTTSNVTTETGKSEGKSVTEVSVEKKKNDSESDVDKNLEFEKQQAALLMEETEKQKREEEEKRKEMAARRMEEEEKHKKEEEKRKKEEELRKEKIRQLEQEERRKEEQERMEMERKKREEEERVRKEKEEQARMKFQEDEEIRRKKDLLLARMKAIDNQEKQNGILDMQLDTEPKDVKPKKLPIFLQSSEKPKESTNEQTAVSNDKEKHKFGSSSSVRSKQSKDSGHEVKESFQNLHHGLPAHPSDQHYRGRQNSLDDDLTSYKPTAGRRREPASNKAETFGSYNPSFGEPINRKNSGLDFGKKQDKKHDKTNDVIFGSYQPTFSSKASNSSSKDGDNIQAQDFLSKRTEGRRARQNQTKSVFGDDLFNDKPKQKVFDSDSNSSFNTTKDKNYPWEKKISVSVEKDESLLPRRTKLNQTFNPVGNMLNGTFEDDIEEVTL